MTDPEVKVITSNPETSVVEETSRLKRFTLNHPRTAKVVSVVAITAATFGVLQAWKSRKQIVHEASEALESVDDSFQDSSETA